MRTLAVHAAALALTLAGCSPRHAPPQRVPAVHNLVTELPAAELHHEVGMLDFGTATARPFLKDGWYPNEGGREGRPTIVWSRGRESVLEFWLATPREIRADFRCSPFDPQDGQPQVVTVELNGRPVGQLTLRPQMNDYSIGLPVVAQAAGRNHLVFRYRKTTRFDRRHLAVSWDMLRFHPVRGQAAELPRAEQRAGRAPALIVPVGSEATFYLPIEEKGTLSLDGVRIQGGAGKKLLVIARADGGQEQVLETIEANRGPRSLELPGRGARLVEISLRAVPFSADATGGFQLLSPTVRTSRTQWPASAEEDTSGGTKPNIIIYLVDTLRADHVGTYGGGSLTPNIDAFAREATVFENTIAQAPWTKPSVAALFTGRGPLSHGVRVLHDRLPQEAVTAAELLSAAGYQTAAFSTNWHIRRETGMDQGFGLFDFSPDEAASDKLNQRVFRWLENQAKSPFFLYAHALDPHEPYTPPPDYRKKYAPDVREEAGYDFDIQRGDNSRGKERRQYIADIRLLYDAEVAFNDHSFGEFLKVLRQRGLYDKSLILFVADHGEAFDEHGMRGHGSQLYAETLNIPLIVKWPGQRRGQRVASISQHVDILPTLLRVAGAKEPPGLPGMDLAAVAASGEDPESLSGRWVLSDLIHRDRAGISLTHAGWRLVYPQTAALAPTSELYHRVSDPGETRNRIGEAPVRVGWLTSLIHAEIERSRKGALKPDHFKMDEETRRALEALGYL